MLIIKFIQFDLNLYWLYLFYNKTTAQFLKEINISLWYLTSQGKCIFIRKMVFFLVYMHDIY